MSELHDIVSKDYAALQERASFAAFRSKFKDIKLASKQEKFNTARDSFLAEPATEVQESVKTAFRTLESAAETAHQNLEAIAERSKNQWVLKSGHTDSEKLASLTEAYDVAQQDLSEFLHGGSGHRLPPYLTEAYHEFEEAVDSAKGILNGLFGRAQIDGIQKAAQNSLKEMQFWTEEAKKTRSIGFAKCTVAAGGAAAIAHGALADKSGDGEERSGMVRIGEILLGAGAIAGALAFGKAR